MLQWHKRTRVIILAKLKSGWIKKGNKNKPGCLLSVRLPRLLNVSLLGRFLLTVATAWHAAVRTLSFSCMRRSARVFSTFHSSIIFLFSPLWREKTRNKIWIVIQLYCERNPCSVFCIISVYQYTLSDNMCKIFTFCMSLGKYTSKLHLYVPSKHQFVLLRSRYASLKY